ncbi:hypothetical protein PVAND_017502 [Polypedilum vanderplanki]|uniref:Thioredoxin n=1 Tax=Polypedilum vanderplanki TaxID=319348 RepID=S6BNH6_POLVA|nr:hypothetical protein PVAND_017502 [Polypedilum vanderplanki]BAN67609.1 thioredoxin [Polypedilum vanderplanki]
MAGRRHSYKVEDEHEFEEKVLHSKEPVMVGFFDKSDQTSKIALFRAQQVVDEMEGKVELAKVFVDELSELSEKYGIKQTPVIDIFQNGEQKGQMSGVHDLVDLRRFVGNTIE